MTEEMITLGKAVERTGGVLQTGPFGSQLHASDYAAVGTPVIMPVNLGDNQIIESGVARVSDAHVMRLRRHALREGDIVFSRRGDVGRRSIVRKSEAGWLCGTGCLAARFGRRTQDVNPAYIALYIGSPHSQSYLFDNAVGGTMPNLNTGILASVPIRLPSRDEQDEIVQTIDSVNDLIATLERLIAKKQAIKQGMMQQLLSGRTRLPGFADEWSHTTLGSVIDVAGGGTPSRGNSSYWGGIIPWATVKDVSRFDADRTQEYITPAALRASSARLVRAGTPVLAARMLVGKAVRFSVDVAINQDLKALLCDDGIDASFLCHWFTVNGAGLAATAGGSTVAGISTQGIKAMPIRLPGVNEQRAIAEALDDTDKDLEVLHVRLSKARAVKIGMMQQLLTGRTRLPVEVSS